MNKTVPVNRPPLGVGSIIREMFSIYFRNFVLLFVLGFVPAWLGYLFMGPLKGFDVALGIGVADFSGFWPVAAFVLSLFFGVILNYIGTAPIVLIAHDEKRNRVAGLSSYLRITLENLRPLVVLPTFTLILIVLGAMFLILPGIWLTAVFYAVVPAIVIERAGFSALRRSVRLTKEYRWPIAIICALFFALNWVNGNLTGDFFLLVSSHVGLVRATIVAAAVDAVVLGLNGVAIALVYARLIDIKEGMNTDQLADVFD